MHWLGITTAFLATIFWACSAFPFTKAGRLMSVPTMNLMRLCLGGLLVFITALVFEFNSITKIFSTSYANAWLWLGLSGVVSLGLGDYLSYRMYTILSPRYGAVFTSISPASALLFGMLMLDETINFIGIIGMAVTIAGVMSMSFSRSERNTIPDHGHGSVLTGVVYGTIGALCHGTGLVFSKMGFVSQSIPGLRIGPVTGSFIRYCVAAVLVISILFFSNTLGKQIKLLQQQTASALKTTLLAIILGPVLAVSCAMISIQYINVAISQTLFALVPVLALFIARYVYKEQITKHSIAGIAMAITGVALLIWRNDLVRLTFG